MRKVSATFLNYFRRRLSAWLDKRVPASQEHHLNLNSIFILPSGFGWSFIILSLCLFLLGTNYQNNLMLLLSYLCLSIMLLTLFYTHQNFARLALKALPPNSFHCNQNGEVQLQPHQFGMTTQKLYTDRMERAKPRNPLNRFAQKVADPHLHFPRSFVGEGHRQNLVRARGARHQQVRDAAGQCLRLAGSRPGKHQHRPIQGFDRFALGWVQPVQISGRSPHHCPLGQGDTCGLKGIFFGKTAHDAKYSAE